MNARQKKTNKSRFGNKHSHYFGLLAMLPKSEIASKLWQVIRFE